MYKCVNHVFNTMDIDTLYEINEAVLKKDFASLKGIEKDLSQTTRKVMEKIKLQSSR